MTQPTKETMKNTLDTLKLGMFPIMLAFVIWFMNDFNKRFRQVEQDLQYIRTDQRLIQRDISELKEDTNSLRSDVDNIKNSLYSQP